MDKGRVLLYLTHEDDATQCQRLEALSALFGDNLYVIWHNHTGRLPSFYEAYNVYTGTPSQISSYLKVRAKGRLNFVCCGIDLTQEWLIENADIYEHAWIMENDVWFRSGDILSRFFDSYDHYDVDLLHHALIPDSDSKPLNNHKECQDFMNTAIDPLYSSCKLDGSLDDNKLYAIASDKSRSLSKEFRASLSRELAHPNHPYNQTLLKSGHHTNHFIASRDYERYDTHQWFYPCLKTTTEAASISPPYYGGSFNFFRMSSRMARALAEWRSKNNNRWIHSEVIWANLHRHDSYSDLTNFQYLGKDPLKQDPSIHLAYRGGAETVNSGGMYISPLVGDAEVDILHPVKGDFLSNEEWKNLAKKSKGSGGVGRGVPFRNLLDPKML